MASRARAFQEACRLQSRERLLRACTPPPKWRRVGEIPLMIQRNTLRFQSPAAAAARKIYVGRSSCRAATRQASTSSGPSRRAITVTSDDGRYGWKELSRGEKAARGTQQTFNFLLVSLGLVGTVTVAYLLYLELISPSSSTVQFNAAVNRIKAFSECRTLLGPSSQIIAYGEPTSSKWARARPLAHSTEVDKYGSTHFRMHFNVEGTESGVKGLVNVHMMKARDGNSLEYQVLSLSVRGHETIYLENKAAGRKGQAGKMFGIQWR